MRKCSNERIHRRVKNGKEKKKQRNLQREAVYSDGQMCSTPQWPLGELHVGSSEYAQPFILNFI